MRPSRLVCLVVLIIAVLVMCAPAEAKTCLTRNNHAAWNHKGGMFRRVSEADKQWIEYDTQHKKQATFVEIGRDAQQLVLLDETRGVQILLRDGVCAVRQEGEETFRQLYQGNFMRMADCT